MSTPASRRTGVANSRIAAPNRPDVANSSDHRPSSGPDGPDGAAHPRGDRITIAEIAEQTGLSIATVSRVLNGHAQVSEATRARVQGALIARGYRRRSSSGNGRAPLVDIVFEGLGDEWGLELLIGAVVAAHSEGLTVAVTSLADRSERRTWFDHISRRGTVGLVLVMSELTARQRDQLDTRGTPFVVIDPRGELGSGVSSVGATNWPGGLAATGHLVELGHRRIATITGPSDMLCSRARLDGYRAALETAHLEVSPELVCTGEFDLRSGYYAAETLFALPEPPTAIFAGNDLQALGVLRAAYERGIRVPQQLSVVGFDDLPISDWSSPPLTTIRQPLTEMAAMAVRIVLESSGSPSSSRQRIEMATELVVRDSTGPPAT